MIDIEVDMKKCRGKKGHACDVYVMSHQTLVLRSLFTVC